MEENPSFNRMLNTASISAGIFLCLSAGILVFNTLRINPYLATDFGQWIMFSRYYLGESTPAYLDPRSVHPIVPIILAIVTKYTNNSIYSIVFVSSFLFTLFLLSSFLAVKELFQDTILADIVVVLVGFGQYLSLFMTTGLLPQLSALIGFNVGLFAIAKISKNVVSRTGWIILASDCICVPFLHIPSAPIFYLAVFFSLSYIGISNKNIGVRTIIHKAIICFFPSLITFGMYVYYYFPIFKEYLTNPSGYYRSGLDSLYSFLSVSKWLLWLVVLAMFSTIFALVCFAKRRMKYKRDAGIIVFLWLLAPLLLMGFSHILMLGTDYGRFIYYFITPFMIFLSLSIMFLVGLATPIHPRFTTSKLISRISKSYLFGIVVFLITIILGNIIFTLRFYPKIVSNLGLKFGQSFLDVISWISSSDDIGTVYAPSRPEATWVEGLTGRATIFPEEYWFTYRPGMIERSLAANVIANALTTVSNDYMYIRHQQVPNGIPFNPNISVMYQGAYANLITLQDRLVSITVSSNGYSQELNLLEDFQSTTILEIVERGSRAQIVVCYDAFFENVKVRKIISLENNSPIIHISFIIQSSKNIQIQKIEFQFADVAEFSSEEVIQKTFLHSIASNSSHIVIKRKNVSKNEISVFLDSHPDPSNIAIFFPVNDMQQSYLKLSFIVHEEAFFELTFDISSDVMMKTNSKRGLTSLSFFDVLTKYDVRYIIVDRADIYVKSAYESNRFPLLYTNWNYDVYKVP